MSATDRASKEQRVRELAYQIWETEGRPEGQASRHWELANKLAAVEEREEPDPAVRARRLRKPQQTPALTTAAGPATSAPPTTTATTSLAAPKIALPGTATRKTAAKTATARTPTVKTGASKTAPAKNPADRKHDA